MEDGIVKSASRTIKILNIFAEVRKPKRAAEIAKIMSIPLSSCVALLDTLVAEGVLNYDFKIREYFPTKQVKHMGSWLDADDCMDFPALIAARRIGGLLGCNWAIGKVRGLDVRWMHSAGGPEATVGGRVPLCTTSAGLAILSLREEDEVSFAVHEHNRRSANETLDLGRVTQLVRQTADRGYAADLNGRNPLSHAIAIGLKSPEHGEEMALCLFVSRISFMRSQEHMLKIIRGCVSVAFNGSAGHEQPLPMVA